MLTDAHLGSTVERVNDAAPIDTVIVQDPAADRNVARNTTVKLTVSSGAEQVLIPFEIRNMTVKDATDLLNGKGFVVKIEAAVGQHRRQGPRDRQQARGRHERAEGRHRDAAGVDGRGTEGDPRRAGTFPGRKPDRRSCRRASTRASSRSCRKSATRSRRDRRRAPILRPGQKVADRHADTGLHLERGGEGRGAARDRQDARRGKVALKSAGFTVSTLNKVDDNNVGKVIEMSPAAGTQVAAGQQHRAHDRHQVARTSSTTSTTTP